MIGFPLLLIPFAIYNMIAFIAPMDWGTKLYTFRLMSGLEWSPTVSDAFIAFSLLMLMFEFIKSTRHGKSLVEHFLAVLLAGGAAAEFVMVNPVTIMKHVGAAIQVGNSTFLLFVVICFVDLFAGFAASLRRARRTVVVAAPEPVAPPVAPAARIEPARVEPARVEPFGKAEPMSASGRTEPVIAPVQKVEP